MNKANKFGFLGLAALIGLVASASAGAIDAAATTAMTSNATLVGALGAVGITITVAFVIWAIVRKGLGKSTVIAGLGSLGMAAASYAGAIDDAAEAAMTSNATLVGSLGAVGITITVAFVIWAIVRKGLGKST